MLQAYNDWHIDEWCAEYPGRFIPLGIVPMWDVDLAVAEVRRVGDEGLPIGQLPRGAARPGLPELPRRATGTRCCRRCATRTWCCRCTSAPGFDLIQQGARSADRPPHHPHGPDLGAGRAGPAVRARRCASFPDLKVALSEGGIGWIPFYLDRADRHFQNQAWLRQRLRRQAADRRVPRAHPRLLHHRPVGPRAAPPHRHRHHRLGVRLPPHRHDVAGVARVRLEGVPGRRRAPTTRSTRSPGRTPAASSTGTRSQHTPKEQATVGALRALATRRRHHRACRARSGASATRPPGSASSDAAPAVDELTFRDRHGIEIFVRRWPTANAVGAVVIAHGASEHSGRYDRFARALNDAGLARVRDRPPRPRPHRGATGKGRMGPPGWCGARRRPRPRRRPGARRRRRPSRPAVRPLLGLVDRARLPHPTLGPPRRRGPVRVPCIARRSAGPRGGARHDHRRGDARHAGRRTVGVQRAVRAGPHAVRLVEPRRRGGRRLPRRPTLR